MVDRFSDQFVQNTVTASGAVVHILFDRSRAAGEGIKEDRRTTEFDFFTHFYISFIIFLTAAQTSSQVSRLPPIRLHNSTGRWHSMASFTSSII